MNEARVGGESSACVETHWFSESGVIDLFLLLGPAITGVFQQYRQLTGSTSLPPVVLAIAVAQFDVASLSVLGLVVVCRLDAAVSVVIMVSITQTSVVVNLGTVSKTSIKLQLSVMLPHCV